jgi:hypothetical protein
MSCDVTSLSECQPLTHGPQSPRLQFGHPISPQSLRSSAGQPVIRRPPLSFRFQSTINLNQLIFNMLLFIYLFIFRCFWFNTERGPHTFIPHHGLLLFHSCLLWCVSSNYCGHCSVILNHKTIDMRSFIASSPGLLWSSVSVLLYIYFRVLLVQHGTRASYFSSLPWPFALSCLPSPACLIELLRSLLHHIDTYFSLLHKVLLVQVWNEAFCYFLSMSGVSCSTVPCFQINKKQ